MLVASLEIASGAVVLNIMEERNPSLKIANEFLTVYSSSPGLKQFKTSHFLGMFNFLVIRGKCVYAQLFLAVVMHV